MANDLTEVIARAINSGALDNAEALTTLPTAKRVLAALREANMPEAMMNAGQAYLDSKCPSKTFYLPATFNWHEFWQAMLAAAEDSPAGGFCNKSIRLKWP